MKVNAQTDTLRFDGYKDFTNYVTNNFRQNYPSLTFFKYKLITPQYNIYDCYKGELTDSLSNTLKYLSLVNDLDVSNFEDDTIINLLYIEDRMIQYVSNNITPISLSLIEYNNFKDSALILEAIDFSDNQFIDNSPSGFYPFKKSILFSSSALNQVFYGRQIDFLFNDSLFLTNILRDSVSSITVDYNDGNGFVALEKGVVKTVNYGDTGVKTIKINIIYKGITYYSASTIMIRDNESKNLAKSSNPPDVGPIAISATASRTVTIFGIPATLSYSVSGHYAVWYSTCNSQHLMRKPYIIATGFNPGKGKQLVSNGNSQMINFLLNNITYSLPFVGWNGDWRGLYYETCNGVYNKYFTPNSNEGGDNLNKYLDKLRDEGYDIVIFMNDDGEGYAIDNAELLIELIKKINTEKFNNGFYFENVVSGYSAGGIASKLALSLMESRHKANPGTNPNPHTKLWVSIEAENQGANVPLGFQQLLKFQKNPVYLIPAISTFILSLNPGITLSNLSMKYWFDFINRIKAKIAYNYNNNPAANELTLYMASSGNSQHSDRTALLYTLANIWGNNSNGYPEFCRRVGVAQGSGLGTAMPYSQTKLFEAELDLGAQGVVVPCVNFFSGGPYCCGNNPCCCTFTSYLPHIGKKTTARWWGNINPSGDIFEGSLYIDNNFTYVPKLCVPLFNVCWGPQTTNFQILYLGHTIVSKPTSPVNFDDAPGSCLAVQRELYDQPVGYSTYAIYNTSLFQVTGTSYANCDNNLHSFASTVSCLDLHEDDPTNNYPPANFNNTDPVNDLNLMYIKPGSHQQYDRFGFPYINHPNDHYRITPYDAVYAIGNNNGNDPNGNARPDNQFHVEDPQIFLGKYLADIEVAPEDLYLSNCTFAGTQSNYTAEFEARNNIIVGEKNINGNSIYSRNGNINYLTPDGKFIVAGDLAYVILHSGDSIMLLPGTEVHYHAKLHAYIQPYNCTNTYPKSLSSTNNDDNYNDHYNQQTTDTLIKIDNELPVKIKVYPVPTHDLLIIENYTDEPGSKIKISNLTGKVIYSEIIRNNQSYKLNLRNFDNGIYILEILNKNNSEKFKIVIAK